LLRVGDYYLVAVMGRDESAGFQQDEGDMYAVVLDDDWSVVETTQLTFNEAPHGGMRPWVARRGDEILFAYDVDVEHFIVEVTINAELFGLDLSERDTGINPVNPATETSEINKTKTGCGCSSSNLGHEWLAWLTALGLVSRRRKTDRSNWFIR